MLEALLDWKRTCAFARCTEESQGTLRTGVGKMVVKLRANGWTDKWFHANQSADGAGGRVPLAWHVFESYMTSRHRLKADQAQGTVYKDWMFQILAAADDPAKACWRAVSTRLLSALKEIVRTEVTAVTFPDDHKNKGTYEPIDGVAPAEGHLDEDADLPGSDLLGSVTAGETAGEEDLVRLVSDSFADYVLGDLDPRQKLILYFRAHEVSFNRIPFALPAVRRLADTARFQTLYASVKPLQDKLAGFAAARLQTEAMTPADVDPYEVLSVLQLLFKKLVPKINAWAEAENLPQPPFA